MFNVVLFGVNCWAIGFASVAALGFHGDQTIGVFAVLINMAIALGNFLRIKDANTSN